MMVQKQVGEISTTKDEQQMLYNKKKCTATINYTTWKADG